MLLTSSYVFPCFVFHSCHSTSKLEPSIVKVELTSKQRMTRRRTAIMSHIPREGEEMRLNYISTSAKLPYSHLEIKTIITLLLCALKLFELS